MRLVVQRVKKASVKDVDKNQIIGEIGKGLFVLVGVKQGDTLKNAEFLADKLAKLRVMSDKNDKMNLTVTKVAGSILVVSQFTLYADTSGGNRPSFIKAALPDDAKKIYEHFLLQLNEKGINIETGNFGAYMKIETTLDGPVTIIIEN